MAQNIIVGAIVIFALVLLIRHLIKGKCGCGCSGSSKSSKNLKNSGPKSSCGYCSLKDGK